MNNKDGETPDVWAEWKAICKLLQISMFNFFITLLRNTINDHILLDNHYVQNLYKSGLVACTRVHNHIPEFMLIIIIHLLLLNQY